MQINIKKISNPFYQYKYPASLIIMIIEKGKKELMAVTLKTLCDTLKKRKDKKLTGHLSCASLSPSDPMRESVECLQL